jgi:hypothetical protein
MLAILRIYAFLLQQPNAQILSAQEQRTQDDIPIEELFSNNTLRTKAEFLPLRCP